MRSVPFRILFQLIESGCSKSAFVSRRHRTTTDWRGLTALIESNLRRLPEFENQARVEGKLSWVPESIGHDNYAFCVADASYFLRMPKKFDPIRSQAESLVILDREMETLRRLERCSVPYHTPKVICEVTDRQGARVGFIETALHGYSLKYMENGWNGRSRLSIAGETAARVHQLPVSDFAHLPTIADSEAHVRSALDELPAVLFKNPVVSAAKEWILGAVTKRSSVLLHGDLLPQNLRCDVQGGEAIGVLDWEYARIGDPAYDLAILTRGHRQPLKEENGFRKLLDAYAEAGGAPIAPSAVRIHELLMNMEWLADSMDARTRRESGGQGPDYYENQMAALLKRSAGV